MSADLSPFSQWALSDARTPEERYLIFLVCDACRLIEHLRHPVEYQRQHLYKSTPYELGKELYLNPLLMPEFNAEDTERAMAMVPWFKKFAPHFSYETRRLGEAGSVLRFFPALEEVSLGGTSMTDVSFVEALPNLRKLQLHSGMLEDLKPFRHCPSLRELSLGFSGVGPPLFTPPLYWLDATPLGELKQLEKLTIYPNYSILAGLSFPALKSAEFSGGSCMQPDCRTLPDMPKLRLLKLDGVQSLRGISRFPELRHLRVTGPLRDFNDISELKKLSVLELDTSDGWPRDVTPLTALAELLWVRFGGESPRNYWPLAQAPRLCEMVAQSKSVQLDVQALSAVLRPWDEVFLLPELRPRAPLRIVAVADGGDWQAVLPQGLPEPGPDYLAHPKLFHLELLWMQKRAEALMEKAAGKENVQQRSYQYPSEIHWNRTLSFEIATLEGARRLPEIIEAWREAMAGSPHAWVFRFHVNLRLTEMEMTEQQKKWLRQIEEESRSRDDGIDLERYRKTQQHLIDTEFRLRMSKEEGEAPDPEDFEPPAEIRPQRYGHSAPVPAGPEDGREDDAAKDNPDFELKPFDEQEQNSDNGGEGDDGDDKDVTTAPPPEPPPNFWEDPYAHPLADSYRFYATLSFDALYYHGHNLATVEQFMGRSPDEYHGPVTEGG